jgi:hypothetical protein
MEDARIERAFRVNGIPDITLLKLPMNSNFWGLANEYQAEVVGRQCLNRNLTLSVA